MFSFMKAFYFPNALIVDAPLHVSAKKLKRGLFVILSTLVVSLYDGIANLYNL